MPKSLRLFIFALACVAFAPTQHPTKQKGIADDPCAKANSQYELNQCTGEQYRKADAHLNSLYRRILDFMGKGLANAEQENDEDQKKFESTAIDKLKAAERAWVQYRDLHCDAAEQQIAGGSMGPMVRAECMKETTEHRIQELKHAYETGDIKFE